eukprot:58807-Prymnesium_polylepis.1
MRSSVPETCGRRSPRLHLGGCLRGVREVFATRGPGLVVPTYAKAVKASQIGVLHPGFSLR